MLRNVSQNISFAKKAKYLSIVNDPFTFFVVRLYKYCRDVGVICHTYLSSQDRVTHLHTHTQTERESNREKELELELVVLILVVP